ncbi:NAD(+) kinase [Alkalilimnicola sp. S0819]|uniref:NAD(+) kinase n=1 Tax=Alkalilimnicola sp. S0819 TaxID=2613922 RepID=UPI0012628AAD|nr:NAD(+) kinase [Alkalilimnicola sp. S0819]KAB7627904.1 NAD(+) kinase [Alkalilimnicola sp. S0819]MPQ15540.1 NAD(+) kinase [Alkalilimnicola sp. S0819]
MQQQFKTIGITGKPRDRAVVDTMARIAEHLAGQSYTILLDADTWGRRRSSLTVASHATVMQDSDLVIAVGGDGTLLNAARALVDRDAPIVGVNRGRLGFLVDVAPGDLSELDRILAGEYTEDSRMLLEAFIEHEGQVLSRGIALNDVVLHRWNSARMIEFETRVEGELLHRHRSDGLIVSTPTGSTAYAMASGGPIIHPDVDAIGLVAISPHTLSNRPLVINAAATVEILINAEAHNHVRVSCDSQSDLGMVSGGRIVIRRHPKRVRILHPPRYRYFEILRAKLRWGDSNLV